MRVALFIPCFVDQFFPQIGVAMVQVLRRIGLQPEFPADQTCCGQPAFNTGFWDEARPLARRFCAIFEPYDAIVCPSGSCTAMVRHFYPELLGGPAAATTKTFEFTEFLVKELGVADVGAVFPAKVTYHDSCHTLRELGVKEYPRKLLRCVRGLELVEMAAAEVCCGFGGTFAVKFPSISTAMADTKIESIRQTGATHVVSTDSSCLMHLDGYLRRQKIPIKTLHLAEVLAAQ